MKKVRDRNRTQGKILEAVGQIIHQEGVGKVTVAAVAQLAGVNRALVHRYYGRRESLIEQYFRCERLRGVERSHLDSNQATMDVTSDGTVAETLTLFLENVWESRATQRELVAEIVTGKLGFCAGIEHKLARLCLVKSEENRRELSAISAFAFGAICYFGVLRATRQTFGDLDLSQEQSLTRIKSVISFMLTAFQPAGER